MLLHSGLCCSHSHANSSWSARSPEQLQRTRRRLKLHPAAAPPACRGAAPPVYSGPPWLQSPWSFSHSQQRRTCCLQQVKRKDAQQLVSPPAEQRGGSCSSWLSAALLPSSLSRSCCSDWWSSCSSRFRPRTSRSRQGSW